MSQDKMITVLGATGTQGGAVVRALLTGGEFTIRAVTRNAASPKAQALARLGAHVVEATLTDEGSLRRAFNEAYGAFLVTPYWEHRSPARELAEVENLISAAQATALRHVAWSTLEDTREVIATDDDRMPVIGDGYRVPHFDVKGGAADALFAKSGLPTTYLLMSFYWDNLLGLAKPQRRRRGLGIEGGGELRIPVPAHLPEPSACSPRSISRLRACWATHARVGSAVIPARWT